MKEPSVPAVIRAVVGLGNPGQKYSKDRHNIGFQIVDALVQRYTGSWKPVDQAVVSEISVDGTPCLVVKPMTGMNLSGAVYPSIKKRGIAVGEMLIVHDELELPFGKLALRSGGSARGHNGLRSYIAQCGDGFWRLRFGIGRPADKADVARYVLSEFTESKDELADAVDASVSLIVGKILGAV